MLCLYCSPPTDRQVDITVQFKPLSDTSVSYELQWKQIHEPEYIKSISVSAADPTATVVQAIATPLEPGQTYCVRLKCQQDGVLGEPSQELICDTEQVGCTPTDQKSCCVVL